MDTLFLIKYETSVVPMQKRIRVFLNIANLWTHYSLSSMKQALCPCKNAFAFFWTLRIYGHIIPYRVWNKRCAHAKTLRRFS